MHNPGTQTDRNEMTNHIHVGLIDWFTTALEIIIFGFLWRSLSVRWAENPVGQAMAFIY